MRPLLVVALEWREASGRIVLLIIYARQPTPERPLKCCAAIVRPKKIAGRFVSEQTV